jgi:hypothetical protein
VLFGQSHRKDPKSFSHHLCHSIARRNRLPMAKTSEFAMALRKPRKVEALFSEPKDLTGLRRLRLRSASSSNLT